MSLLDKILGKPLAAWEEDQQKIGVLAGVPMLGLDALSSSSYGPEAALVILIPLGALGLNYIGPIVLVILGLLIVLYLSYRQTIEAYPTGGGSYTVAKQNLGVRAGLLAAAALMLDYVLNVAVGISAGIGALVSAVPGLHSHILALCLAALGLITLVNLRGARESAVVFGVPTYLFIGSLGTVLIVGLVKAIQSGGHPVPVVPPPALPAAAATASLWLLMRSFASGCTAMTGVEAVSNGVNAFAEPRAKKAQGTLTAIVGTLAVLLIGIAWLSHAYHIGAMDQAKPGYQSIISQLLTSIVGRGVVYYITIGSVLAVLTLSANTSFAGFPRLCQLVAEDDYLPHAFANRGRRLVYSLGIIILAVMAGVLLVIFGGITDRLIPLFAVGAFLAFTLSQAGMVMHWRREGSRKAMGSLVMNAIGAVCTALALAIILVAKFREGAWITVLLIPGMVFLFLLVKRHYRHIAVELRYAKPLDLSNLQPPVVVVPVEEWTILAARGLRFALRLSPDVIVVHINKGEEDEEALRRQWEKYVRDPVLQAHLSEPQLRMIDSPYRLLHQPLLGYIEELKAEYPTRLISVIIPELVETKWYQYLLHNHRAMGLKAALLLHGDHRVVVVNIPWYHRDEVPLARSREFQLL